MSSPPLATASIKLVCKGVPHAVWGLISIGQSLSSGHLEATNERTDSGTEASRQDASVWTKFTSCAAAERVRTSAFALALAAARAPAAAAASAQRATSVARAASSLAAASWSRRVACHGVGGGTTKLAKKLVGSLGLPLGSPLKALTLRHKRAR